MQVEYEVEDNGQDKVVMFFGWQGSTPRHRAKYLQLWKELGYNCISTGMRFDHMHFPPSLLQRRAVKFCQELQERKWDKMPLIIHSCSNGGFHNTMAFTSVILNNNKYKYINDNLRGIILDSAPAKQVWRGFFALASLNFGPVRAALLLSIFSSLMLAAKTVRPIIGKTALSNFTEWNLERMTQCVGRELMSYKHLPLLFLYSKKDALTSYHDVDEMIETLRANGAKKIRSKLWEDTEHVGHYRQRPEEYKNEIIAFLTPAARL